MVKQRSYIRGSLVGRAVHMRHCGVGSKLVSDKDIWYDDCNLIVKLGASGCWNIESWLGISLPNLGAPVPSHVSVWCLLFMVYLGGTSLLTAETLSPTNNCTNKHQVKFLFQKVDRKLTNYEPELAFSAQSLRNKLQKNFTITSNSLCHWV